MIKFENVEVTYDDFVAIPDFNLEIREGEFFTFLGPSGCGKTTALRALAGLIQPTSGKIYIDGKDVTKLPSDKRHVGMVFQNYALFPTMSVYENIVFGLKVNKLSRDEIDDRVKAIAKEVELSDQQLQRNIGELSGGQQQRVAIARSLIMRPKILLLDEPLSNLDAKLRQQLRVQIKDMQRHFGITSVYVTHDQTEALTMSDGIAVINAGRIEQIGTPREVYSHSQTEFVCTFIGEANKLSVDALRKQGIETPGNSAYVRVERVYLNTSQTQIPEDRVVFTGKIVDSRYEGTNTAYLVDYGAQDLMQAIVKEDGSSPFHIGEECVVSVNRSDILFYEGQ